jgi:alkanesulfonate monooxygenase SsuD/methylene tetrahydromethanopterin reductase-like flavin-dependent oxidoreductase (luciferase family)
VDRSVSAPRIGISIPTQVLPSRIGPTISGDPEQCAAKIGRLHEAGVDTLVLALPAEQADLLTRELVPLLR